MEKLIFFGLIIPILIFVVYLGGRAIMTGLSVKNSNRSNLENEINQETKNPLNDHENLSSELKKLNELLKSGILTKEEFEKAKKKLLN